VFNNNEIAQKALKRAAEIKEERKRITRILQNGTILSIFSAVLVSAMVITNGVDDTKLVNFEDAPVPLAQSPVVSENACSECELEPEDENCECYR